MSACLCHLRQRGARPAHRFYDGGAAAPAGTTGAVTAVEVIDAPGELARAVDGAAKEGSAATLLFSMVLVSMPGAALANPPSPTAVEGGSMGEQP